MKTIIVAACLALGSTAANAEVFKCGKSFQDHPCQTAAPAKAQTKKEQAEHKKHHHRGHKHPTSKPTPKPTPSPAPTPSPKPTPTPKPTPSPAPTPSPTTDPEAHADTEPRAGTDSGSRADTDPDADAYTGHRRRLVLRARLVAGLHRRPSAKRSKRQRRAAMAATSMKRNGPYRAGASDTTTGRPFIVPSPRPSQVTMCPLRSAARRSRTSQCCKTSSSVTESTARVSRPNSSTK